MHFPHGIVNVAQGAQFAQEGSKMIPRVEIAKSNKALIAEIDETATPDGKGAFWWLGQHSFIVKAGGKTIYIDPFLAEWESRQTPPLLKPEEVTNANIVLVTHGHGDHLDPFALKGILSASPEALFINPKTEAERMRNECGVPANRMSSLSAGDSVRVSGVEISAIKSKHESFDEHPTLGFPYLGYVVEVGGVSFYHSGDTILYDGLLNYLKAWKRFDAIFLPINGRDAERFLSGCLGNFTFQEAVELCGELRPGLAVPAHYDMFLGNQENPAKFTRYLEAKFPDVPHWAGRAGEKVLFGEV